MIPVLYDKDEYRFVSNGFGRLSDAISCVTEETRNGEYALTMVYPMSGIHFDDIQNDRIILATAPDGDLQPFRISEIKRTLDGKQIEVYAPHMSYDLAKMVVKPFSAQSCNEAFAVLPNYIEGNTRYTFSTDKVVESSYKLSKPMQLRELLGGTTGSFTDVYGQIEYTFDKFNVIGSLHRGADRGVTIRYAKNMTALEIDETDNRYTAILPFVYKDSSGNSGAECILGSVLKTDNYDAKRPMIKVLDVSSSWTDNENMPTTDQVTALGKKYLEQTPDLSVIAKSITASFIDLSSTEEYRNVAPLLQVKLCDTVHVLFEDLGVNTTSKVIRIKYNVLLDRTEEVELGTTQNNLSSTMKDVVTAATAELPDKDFLFEAQRHAADMILGGLGGVIYIRRDGNGYPVEIIICSALPDGSLPASYEEATNGYWRWNANGLGFFEKYTDSVDMAEDNVAITKDGAINATKITVGILNAQLIKAGILTDKKGANYWDMDTGEFSLSASTQVGDSTIASASDVSSAKESANNYADSAAGSAQTAAQKYADSAAGSAQSAAESYADSASAAAVAAQTQESIFNKLTNNGATQGIYLKDGKLYLNGTYMDMGTINADLIKAGTLTLGNSSNYAKKFSVLSGSGSELIAIDEDGLLEHISTWTTNSYISMRPDIFGGMAIMANSTGTGKATALASDGVVIKNNSDALLSSFSLQYPGVTLAYDHIYFDKSLMGDSVHIDTTYGIRTSLSKSRIVHTEDYGSRLLYCYETPSPLFGDVGEGEIGEDGLTYVQIDPTFAETITTSQYQVFLQPYGDGKCYVKERHSTYFIVAGDAGLAFGWEMKAKQSDYDQYRLESCTQQEPEKDTTDYGGSAIDHMSDITKERVAS